MKVIQCQDSRSLFSPKFNNNSNNNTLLHKNHITFLTIFFLKSNIFSMYNVTYKILILCVLISGTQPYTLPYPRTWVEKLK